MIAIQLQLVISIGMFTYHSKKSIQTRACLLLYMGSSFIKTRCKTPLSRIPRLLLSFIVCVPFSKDVARVCCSEIGLLLWKTFSCLVPEASSCARPMQGDYLATNWKTFSCLLPETASCVQQMGWPFYYTTGFAALYNLWKDVLVFGAGSSLHACARRMRITFHPVFIN